MVLEINNRTQAPLDKKYLRQIINKASRLLKIPLKSIEISLGVVAGPEMRRLNKQYKGHNRLTDVLSYPLSSLTGKKSDRPKLSGEIIICYPRALSQARCLEHSVKKELAILFLHGFLHLLGYDHRDRKEAGRMNELIEKILS